MCHVNLNCRGCALPHSKFCRGDMTGLRQVSLSKFIVCFHIISYVCVQKLSSWKLFEGEVCLFSSIFFFSFNGALTHKMEKEMATLSNICA